MARWGRPLLRCTVSNVCAEGELTVGVFKTSDQIQKGPSAEQTHHQKILYISSYINTDAYCPCQVAWHAKHPFWRIEPYTTPRTQLFRLILQAFPEYIYQAVPLQIGAHGKRKRAGTTFIGLAHYPFLCFHRGVA